MRAKRVLYGVVLSSAVVALLVLAALLPSGDAGAVPKKGGGGPSIKVQLTAQVQTDGSLLLTATSQDKGPIVGAGFSSNDLDVTNQTVAVDQGSKYYAEVTLTAPTTAGLYPVLYSIVETASNGDTVSGGGAVDVIVDAAGNITFTIIQ